MKYFLGIDPGKTGGWAVLDSDGNHIASEVFTNFKTFGKKLDDLEVKAADMFGCIEHVHAIPKQGVNSVFTFGSNYGGWLAALEIFFIPHQLIPPVRWQREILGSFPPGESKQRALAFAQRRWPTLNLMKKDDGVVDALCIALYALRLHSNQISQSQCISS